jgi:hypothetical protein
MRGLLARTYELVRRDIPRKIVEVDYQTLEHALINQADFVKLFGITNLNNPSAINISHPYSLTTVAEKLGYNKWYYASQLIDKVKTLKGIDLKASDNKYHVAIKSGKVGKNRKYSDAMIDLLELVRDEKDFDLDM